MASLELHEIRFIGQNARKRYDGLAYSGGRGYAIQGQRGLRFMQGRVGVVPLDIGEPFVVYVKGVGRIGGVWEYTVKRRVHKVESPNMANFDFSMEVAIP